MKNSILFILIIFLIGDSVNAQSSFCWNSPSTITTDWRVPGSPNSWNWTLAGNSHPVYLSNDMNNYSFLMELPYFCGGGLGTGGCGNLNTLQYLFIQPSNQDIKPEDGWELIIKNFGTPNSSPTAHDGQGVDNPFFILYNKYTGRMKIFIALIGNDQASSAYIRTYFNDKQLKRALFSYANPISETLINFYSQLDFKTMNDYAVTNSATSYYWMLSEIQTSYDPGTCSTINLPTFNSTVIVRPYTVTTSTINAEIDGTETQKILENGSIVATTDGKTSFSDKLIEAGKAGIKGYSEWNGYKAEYDKMVDKKNSDYKNKLVKDWFEAYVRKHKEYRGIKGLNDKIELWENLGKTDDEFKFSIGVDGLEKYEQNSDWYQLKTVASFLPYVGTAIGVVDFLVSGAKSASPPKPSPPMVFNVSLKLKGTFSTELPHSPISFLNPGSPAFSSDISMQPYYNNILGVFNILKQPKVKYGAIKPNTPLGWRGFTEVDGSVSYDITKDALIMNPELYNDQIKKYLERPIFKQYKLEDDIKYIVNPAANVDVELIDACFVIEYKKNTILFADQRNFSQLESTESFPYYPSIFSSTKTRSERIEQIEKTGLDLEYISNDNSTLRFRTKYVPLTCLKQLNFILLNGAPPRIFVKMIVKMERKDLSNAESITQIVTYDISNAFNTASEDKTLDCKINLEREDLVKEAFVTGTNTIQATFVDFKIHEQYLNTSNFSCFPYPIFFKDITYLNGMNNSELDGIYGTVLIPQNTIVSDNTTIRSKQIVIENNITFGNNVNLISEEDIEVPSEQILMPNLTLQIRDLDILQLWDCPNVPINTVQGTDEEILAAISSSDYVNSVNAGKTNPENNIDKFSNNAENLKLTIWPNPAQDAVTIEFDGKSNTQYDFAIRDLAGKEYWNTINFHSETDGLQTLKMNLKDLSEGVYFITLKINELEVKTFKIVVVR